VRVFNRGIELAQTRGVTSSALLAEASTLPQITHKTRDDQAVKVFFHDVDDWTYALVIAMSGQDAYCAAFEKTDGEIVLQVEELEAGKSLVHFNHAVIHRETGLGLYQWYRSSVGIGLFEAVIRNNIHEPLRKRLYDEATREEKHQHTSRGNPAFEIRRVVAHKHFAEIMEDMKYIRELRLSYTVLDYELSERSPSLTELGGVETVDQCIRFARKTSLKEKLQGLFQLAERSGVQRARATGVGEDGEEQVVEFGMNYASFGHDDYSEVLGGITVRPKDFHNSETISMLRASAETHLKDYITKKSLRPR
jgi:hypothetical protein